MNPNKRFQRKHKEVQEDIEVYDIEKHSKQILEKEDQLEKRKIDLKEKIKNLKLHLIKRFLAFILDLFFAAVFLLGLSIIFGTVFILGILGGDQYDIVNLFETAWDWNWVYLWGGIWFENGNNFLKIIFFTSQNVFIALFFAFLERGQSQATLGKRIVSLVVVNENGEKLNYDQSFKRNFLKLCVFPIIGLLFEERRMLHNKWSEAIIVNKLDINKLKIKWGKI